MGSPVAPEVPDADRVGNGTLALLESNAREHREIAPLDNTYENYIEVTAGTLVLFGRKSGLPSAPIAVENLKVVLPSVDVKRFSNLDHFAPDRTGPREVAQVVRAFFTS
jgi:hypothetical protein